MPMTSEFMCDIYEKVISLKRQMKMKRLNIILMSVLLALSSCYKDEGNYDFTDLNEITVGDDVTSYAVDRYDTLKINPQLQFSHGTIPDDQLDFSWEMYLDDWANSEGSATLLSKEKNLCVRISKPASVKDYAVVLNVKNKCDGAEYRFKYNVSVQPSILSGLLVLQNDGGRCRLDYLASPHAEPTFANAHHIADVYAAANASSVEGEPRGVSFTLVTKSSYEPQVKRVYMWTDKEIVQMDASDFTRQYANAELFMTPPAVVDVKNVVRAGFYNNMSVMINGTDAHALNQQTSMSYGYQFSGVLLPNSSLSGEMQFSKYVYQPDDFSSYTGFDAILYDQKGKRFVKVDHSNSYEPDLKAFEMQTDANKQIFDVNNIGMNLDWMGKGNGGQGFAVFSNGDARYIYRCRFNIRSTLENTDGSDSEVEINPQVYSVAMAKYDLCAAENGANAKYFDVNRYANTLMYATDRDLYVYDFMSKKATRVNDDFPENEKITAIKIYNVEYSTSNLNDVSGTLLYVATWDGEEGRVYEFPLNRTSNRLNNRTSATGNLKEPYAVFAGFGKVVDMCVKCQGFSD